MRWKRKEKQMLVNDEKNEDYEGYVDSIVDPVANTLI